MLLILGFVGMGIFVNLIVVIQDIPTITIIAVVVCNTFLCLAGIGTTRGLVREESIRQGVKELLEDDNKP